MAASDKDVADLACLIANHWKRDRIHFADALRRCGPELQRALDMLEAMTRGDERRCYCLSKTSGHDVQCPAFKSASRANVSYCEGCGKTVEQCNARVLGSCHGYRRW